MTGPASTAEVLDPYRAFDRDVPAHLQEDAMQAMAEATGQYGTPSNVYILEHDRLDAINCRASGIITIDGAEYTFQMEDGNRNGTSLLAWESDRPFEKHEPTRWALQPQRDLVAKTLESGRGPFLILKWDAVLSNRKELAELPSRYSYDCYVQPGGKTETYYHKKAAEHQFEIVTEDEASATRAALARTEAAK